MHHASATDKGLFGLGLWFGCAASAAKFVKECTEVVHVSDAHCGACVPQAWRLGDDFTRHYPWAAGPIRGLQLVVP